MIAGGLGGFIWGLQSAVKNLGSLVSASDQGMMRGASD